MSMGRGYNQLLDRFGGRKLVMAKLQVTTHFGNKLA